MKKNYNNNNRREKHKLLKAVLIFLISFISMATIGSSNVWAENNKTSGFDAKDILDKLADQELRVVAIKLCIPGNVTGSGLKINTTNGNFINYDGGSWGAYTVANNVEKLFFNAAASQSEFSDQDGDQEWSVSGLKRK